MAAMAAQIVCSVGPPAPIPRQCSGFSRAPAAAARASFRCRASPEENASRFVKYVNLDALDNTVQVFRDESKGIVCYRTPTGEITCEGIDEGPHFEPAADYPKGFFLSQLVGARKGAEEPLVNGAGI